MAHIVRIRAVASHQELSAQDREEQVQLLIGDNYSTVYEYKMVQIDREYGQSSTEGLHMRPKSHHRGDSGTSLLHHSLQTFNSATASQNDMSHFTGIQIEPEAALEPYITTRNIF